MELYKSILVSIVIIVLSSCRPLTSSPEKFTVPMSDIGADVQKNKYLQVIVPEGWNSFKTGETISLDVRNTSESQITFAPDLGARIFVFIEQDWIEVGNEIIYQNDSLTLDPSDNWYADKTASVVILPALSDTSVPYYLRIFVIGDFMENGKVSKKVGSYIDIKLAP